MTRRGKLSSTVPKREPILAQLGIARAGDENLPRIADLHRISLRRSASHRIVIQAVAACAVAGISWSHVPLFAIAGWLALIAISLRFTVRPHQALSPVERDAGQSELPPLTVSTVLNALAWAMPTAFAALAGDLAFQAQLWTVGACLMGACAVMLPATPLHSLLLAAIVGSLQCAAFLVGGQIALACSALGFALVTVIGTMQSARRYRVTKIAITLMDEKDEMVSLLLREFEEGDADWLWQIDGARRVHSTSPRFAFALGREPRDVDGWSFLELLGASDPPIDGAVHPTLLDLAARLSRREHFTSLLVQASINGRPRWWQLSGTPRINDRGRFAGFHGVGSDVTVARESSEKIAYLARYDTLTGLPNRLMLTEELTTALERAETENLQCAFLMIDLDRFKAVNDTLGHQIGDQLLARVSERLTQQLGDNALCCRMGGDEFAIVIPDAGDDGKVAETARRVIERLTQPYMIDNHQLFVGASVGSAVGPRDGSSGETLMRNADLALYRAKDAGGNAHFIYEPALHAVAQERRQLEASLRHALAAGEFSLQYQPVVDATSESVVSFEALLRWNSAEHGPISPVKFVPVAEDTRLIIPIGAWVLRQACVEAMHWPEPIRIAVNVSGEQLLDPGFADTVVKALAYSGLDPRRLEIEVTESIFVRDASLARTALERVIALGCSVALDDFGTGYSSLGYLRELRFSTIKVDRSFVRGAAEDNPECLAIIRAVVALAESLDMSTTAEGVETDKELEVIRALRCRKIQGYYFGRPISASDAGQLFEPHLSMAAR